MNEILQARLVNGDFSRLEHIDLALIVINANDVVSDLRKTRAADQTNIPGTNDADFHK